MITISDTVDLVAAYVRSKKRGVVGLQRSPVQLPIYEDASGSALPICHLAVTDPSVGSRCRDFYSGIGRRTGSAICPWGIKLEYVRVEHPEQHFGLYRPVEISEYPKKVIQELPRKQKKAVKNALEATKLDWALQNADAGLGEKFSRVVDTILSGRTAGAIRALAHELQTPVQGAFGDALSFMDFAQRNHLPPNAEERASRLVRNLQSIADLARRIPVLITTDLGFSPAQLRPVLVHATVDKLFERLGEAAERRHIHLRREYNHGPTTVEAIPDQFELLMHNLLDNAIKYSFAGKHDRPNEVHVGFRRRSTALEIAVTNNGCRITESEISEGRIFELGYRGEFSSDRDRPGTGSGLYVASRLTRGHGGVIEVESRRIDTKADMNLAKTVFRVVWPIESPGEAQAALPL